VHYKKLKMLEKEKFIIKINVRKYKEKLLVKKFINLVKTLF